jgi:hypothetical protein
MMRRCLFAAIAWPAVLAAQAVDATAASGTSLLGRIAIALGGEDRLGRASSLLIQGERVIPDGFTSLSKAKRDQHSKVGIILQRPAKYRIEEAFVLGAGGLGPNNFTCFDGSGVWAGQQAAKVPDGHRIQVDPPQVGTPDQQRNVRFDGMTYLAALLLYAAPGVAFRDGGESETAGQRFRVLEGSGPDSFKLQILVDPESSLPRAVLRGSTEWRLSDYRLVDGTRFPFRIEFLAAGQMKSYMVFEHYVINPDLTGNEFRK